MILMKLGPVTFEASPRPLNAHEHSGERKYPFVTHDVLGVEPVLEKMGPDNKIVKIEGTIHPHHFGGVPQLRALESAQLRGTPLPLMRGDRRPLGWYVIEHFEEQHDVLDHHGVGREIKFQATLRSVGRPGSGMAGAIMSIFRLFGG